jgi:hypothetical protein
LSDEARKNAINELPANQKIQILEQITGIAGQPLGLILLDEIERIAKSRK